MNTLGEAIAEKLTSNPYYYSYELSRDNFITVPFNSCDKFSIRPNPKDNEILVSWLAGDEAKAKVAAVFKKSIINYPEGINPDNIRVDVAIDSNGFAFYRFFFFSYEMENGGCEDV